ncbi:MAG: hypothetical protein Q8N49_00230 [Candidatus Omnitrophota bacterium]|nr:hypothetical protein [Candidatus Omnitrophota bacterium]
MVVSGIIALMATIAIPVTIKAPHGETKLCFAYDPDKHLIEFIEDLK